MGYLQENVCKFQEFIINKRLLDVFVRFLSFLICIYCFKIENKVGNYCISEATLKLNFGGCAGNATKHKCRSVSIEFRFTFAVI